MSKFRLHTIFTALLAILFVGCQRDSFYNDGEGELLRFRCDSIATRSAGYTGSGQTAILSMGVYAAHTNDDWNGNAPLNFMQNRKVERTDAASPWNYSPEAYWPGSGQTSFFAYAPYDAAGLVRSGTNGVPQMEFTVAADHDQQVDLLTAIPLKNQTKSSSTGGYASFMLRHALTRISFAAKTSVVTPDDMRITGLTLNNLHHKGTSSMDGSDRQWTPSTDATAVYTLSTVGRGGLNGEQLTSDYETITTADGNLFLLPQIITDAAELVISYTNNGTPGTPVTIKLADVLAQWQPGEALRFLINLAATDPTKPFDVELTYTFVPWDNHYTDTEINQDPFLYVTDVSTSSYDAAITRVYFYTNEPKAKVFIDPIGRVGSLVGATVSVKGEFHALVKDDPDGTANFFFDEATHQGWIDLINRNTTTTGTKQPLLIKLCAGKLERHITVRPVISVEAASQNTQRYIGTFHRRNEMGERIVTWHLDKEISWTATVENTGGDSEELIIDRMASPDFRDNLLYSLVPREAEGAKVEHHRSVSGKGRVYFRVGWKSYSSTANRYARIKVAYSGANAPAEDVIYCRQGEETDLLAPGSHAYNFTVYNLAGDGVFVDYPTQGGFISQWGRPRLWPLIGDAAPAGYPLGENMEDLDPDVNICPDRYTYLNATSIAELQTSLGYLAPKWGYYADGFFDRRSITEHRVDNASVNVASAGILLSFATNFHSVFVPTTGYRNETGELLGKGTVGGYWAGYQESEGSKNAIAIKVFDGFTATDIKGYDKRNSFFLRCVKIPNAVVLYFDANGGENEPRPVSTSQNTAVRIPSKSPSDYWKENYVFEGWNTAKNGTGTTHAPGSNFTMKTTDQTLYAKWTPNYFMVDFRSSFTEAEQATYLLPTTGPLTSYSGYEIGSNGARLYSTLYLANEISDIAAQEKAYSNLEFHKELKSDAWVNAYTYCKNLDGGTEGWRLPRAIELALMANHKNNDMKAAIFGGMSMLWSGTEYSSGNNGKAFQITTGVFTQAEWKSEQRYFRCVRELK